MSPSPVEQRLRSFCRVVAVLISLGAIIELWLVGHTEGVVQWVPFMACTVVVASIGLVTARCTQRVVRIHRVLMVAVAGAAVYGLYAHLDGNAEFAREIRPNAPSAEVWWSAVRGASPVLASGVLAVAAALGLAGVHGIEPRESADSG